MGKTDVIKEELGKQIKKHEALVRRARIDGGLIRISAMLLSAGITILLGVKGYTGGTEWEPVLSISAVVVSAILTSLATLEAFVDTGARWVRVSSTLHQLYALRRELEFRVTDGALSKQDCERLFLALQSALDRKEWTERRSRSLTAPLPTRPGS